MEIITLPIVMFGCFSLLSANVAAQELQESYIKWSNFSSYKLPSAISTWKSKKQITEDDNFFISRVKPKKRFRNAATQVRQNLKEADDKRLIAWIPFNDPKKKGGLQKLFYTHPPISDRIERLKNM